MNDLFDECPACGGELTEKGCDNMFCPEYEPSTMKGGKP